MLAKLMGYFLLGLIRVLTGSQARWHGCPPKAEQRIYFANHQSHADDENDHHEELETPRVPLLHRLGEFSQPFPPVRMLLVFVQTFRHLDYPVDEPPGWPRRRVSADPRCVALGAG